jgi:hypothetical protein
MLLFLMPIKGSHVEFMSSVSNPEMSISGSNISYNSKRNLKNNILHTS